MQDRGDSGGALVAVGLATPAAADPLPGFDLDPVQLEARMDACMAYAGGEQEILMGWINLRTGQRRQWRCSSLRHMMEDLPRRRPHDPYVDVSSFIVCFDEVVSHGFPRPSDPGYTNLIYQYDGARDRAIAAVKGRHRRHRHLLHEHQQRLGGLRAQPTMVTCDLPVRSSGSARFGPPSGIA